MEDKIQKVLAMTASGATRNEACNALAEKIDSLHDDRITITQMDAESHPIRTTYHLTITGDATKIRRKITAWYDDNLGIYTAYVNN